MGIFCRKVEDKVDYLTARVDALERKIDEREMIIAQNEHTISQIISECAKLRELLEQKGEE